MALKLLADQNRCSFERKFGKYTLSRVYQVDDCSPEKCIGLAYEAGVTADGKPVGNAVPGNVQIKDNSTYCGDDGTTITCYATDRDASNPDAMAGQDFTFLSVVYVGWKLGPLYWEQRIYTGGEQLTYSIDNPPKQIGADYEGTSVQRPRIELVIYENVTGDKMMFGGKLALVEELTGTVNESGWNPSVTEVALAYPEGSWMYMGADINHFPGGMFNLTHKFFQIPLYCNCGIDWGGSGRDDTHSYGSGSYPCSWPCMQSFKYRPYYDHGSSVDFGGSVGVRGREVRKWGESETVKVACIAGTDTVHSFSDLEL